VPLFVHVVLATHEVVVRGRDVAVDAGPEFLAKLETVLGAGAVTVERAGRA
jgi:hypothetical protein